MLFLIMTIFYLYSYYNKPFIQPNKKSNKGDEDASKEQDLNKSISSQDNQHKTPQIIQKATEPVTNVTDIHNVIAITYKLFRFQIIFSLFKP